MATVTAISPIKSHTHIANAINYVKSPTDSNEHEKAHEVSCINCYDSQIDSLSAQFYRTRAANNNDKGILVHHYVQSFAPDENISPEEAHQIGLELVKKTMPGYQIVVSTHIDKDHIHNHILINSVNAQTGYKWLGNKDTLSDLRTESDEICKIHNLSVLPTPGTTERKSIDQTTYQMAMQGKSWKVKLTDDLDEAALNCTSRDGFIKFMNERGYKVNYQNLNITLQAEGQKKKIRVDTLARQFGDRYKKAELEKQMGYYVEHTQPEVKEVASASPGRKKKNHKNEYQRYEAWFFGKLNLKKFSSLASGMKITALKPIKLLTGLYSSYVRRAREERFACAFKPSKQIHSIVKPVMYCGNIKFGQFREMQGKDITINISVDKLLKLVGAPVFYAAKINSKTETATVTFKECNMPLFAEKLGLEESVIRNQSEAISNSKMYREIKTVAATAQQKPIYRIVTPEQLEVLKAENLKVAYFSKDDKFNIAYLADDAALIETHLAKHKPESEFDRNRRINRELKAKAAKSGQDLRYKLITAEQLKKLKETNVEFACFEKDGKYNIAYLSDDERNVAKAIHAGVLIQNN